MLLAVETVDVGGILDDAVNAVPDVFKIFGVDRSLHPPVLGNPAGAPIVTAENADGADGHPDAVGVALVDHHPVRRQAAQTRLPG